jgi:hypothetical protein
MLLKTIRRNAGVRILLLVILFTIALSILIVTVSTRERLVQGAGFSLPSSETLIAEGLEIRPNTLDVFVFIPSFRIAPPSGSGIASSSLVFTLDDIGFYTYDTSAEQDMDTVCVDAINLATTYTDPTLGEFLAGVDLLQGAEPLCYDIGQPLPSASGANVAVNLQTSTRNSTTHQLYDSIFFRAISGNMLERYPYDGFRMQAILQFHYRVLNGDTQVNQGVARPFTVWLFETSSERNWNIQFESQRGMKDSPDDEPRDVLNFIPNGVYEQVTFTFDRPLLFRLTYPFLIGAMLLIIGLLPFIRELDGLLEITAAILFGIFGLRQVMTLPNSQGQTILDVLFIGLYMVLAFTFVVTILTRSTIVRRSDPVDAPTDPASTKASDT